MITDWVDINVREQEILKLAVGTHIRTAQPVSSLYLVENNQIPFSSATVRSIFVELENKHYLHSPHRSSGRLPTERAYRFYVENLPEERIIDNEDRTQAQKEYLKCEFRLDEILDGTSKILSLLTNYAGVVMGPQPEESVLKHIELIDMGEDEVLVLILTRSGAIHNRSLYLENRIPPDFLQKISRTLNDTYKGMELGEIKRELYERVRGGDDFLQYYLPVARILADSIEALRGDEAVFLHGVERLLVQTSADSGTTLNLGSLFESKEYLKGILRNAIQLDDVNVIIDGDRDERLAGISIVTAGYKMGEKRIGTVGVIGPNRMDYLRIISIVDYLNLLLSGMITRLSN
jgi:heat-inducible transcriptional repressor